MALIRALRTASTHQGRYDFDGDPLAVPEAPAWLIAEMRAAKKPEILDQESDGTWI